jgi:hypothetical protein
MAGDWIPVDHELPDRPQIAYLRGHHADELRTPCGHDADSVALIIGRMVLFWIRGDRYTVDGALQHMDYAAAAVAFGGSEEFWKSVEAVGWAQFADGSMRIPGFEERFGKSARRRMLDAKRKAQSRAFGGPHADTMRTGSGRAGDPLSLSQSVSLSEEDETRRDDHEFSWTKETREHVREFCGRKFSRGPSAVFPVPIREDDREFLLKVGALFVDGKLPEAIIDSGLEAIRQHNQPVNKRGGYLTRVLQDACASRGINLNLLLAKIQVPEDLLRRSNKAS